MDGFIAKLDNDGKPVWSTYFGGDGYDFGSNLGITGEGNPILFGYTTSTNLPTSNNSFQQRNNGAVDDFIVKFSKTGKIDWMTYYGGSNLEGIPGHHIADQQGGIAVNHQGDIMIVNGQTNSNDLYVTDDAFQKKFNSIKDAYIVVFDRNGNLVFSSYLGGNNDDIGYDCVFDNDGNIIIVGRTESNDFYVTDNAFQKHYGTNTDGFIVKIGKPIECGGENFYFPNNTSEPDFSFRGWASLMNEGKVFIRLTPSQEITRGGVWYKNKLPVGNGFSTKFSFRFFDGDNGKVDEGSYPGADGIAFVIHNHRIDAIGNYGGGIGYSGIPNSLAVEFDVYNNNQAVDNIEDPNGNHIAVQSKGSEPNTSAHHTGANLAINSDIIEIISDSTVYYPEIIYKPNTKKLSVYFGTSRENLSQVAVVNDIDLARLLDLDDNTKAWIGFTAATGNAMQIQDIMEWEICVDGSGAVSIEGDSIISRNMLVPSPNPAFDNIFIPILSDNQSPVVIKIFDILGNVVDEIEIDQSLIANGGINLNILHYPIGFYYFVLNDGYSVKSGSFIKVK